MNMVTFAWTTSRQFAGQEVSASFASKDTTTVLRGLHAKHPRTWCSLDGHRSVNPTGTGTNSGSLQRSRMHYVALVTGADSDKILLRAASHSPNPSVIEALCEAGATVHFVDENYKTALHRAASFNNNPEIISTLASLGADVDARDWEGRTPLHDAAQFYF